MSGVLRRDERGSAMVIALLVAFVMSVMGVSFLLMAQAESNIARNERLGVQALYAAESVAEVVTRWFDAPGGAIGFPPDAAVDRTLRELLDESDPYGSPALLQNGGTRPRYKQGIDEVTPAGDDLFERPYRGADVHALLGTREGPDMLIEGLPGTDAGDFLSTLGDTLWGDFPGRGLRARVVSIRVFAPPYVEVGGVWGRYGMGTIEVDVAIERQVDAVTETLARRAVTAVIAEAPYRGPYGPLHSCADLTLTGSPPGPHWGAVTAQGRMTLFASDVTELPLGVPRRIPSAGPIDRQWPLTESAMGDLEERIEYQDVVDPFFRALSAGPIVGIGVTDEQPVASASPAVLDRSYLFQNLAAIGCPLYDYETWKAIATSGAPNVRYFEWTGSGFRENGHAPTASFRVLTDGGEGIYFFDTVDGLEPADDDGDGVLDNLTPPVVVSGGTWSFRGVIFLNATSFKTTGLTGVTRTLNAPGEPWVDLNGDDVYTTADTFHNLRYPTTLAGPFVTDRFDYYDEAYMPPVGPSEIRNEYGPSIDASVSLEGILFTSGRFEATGDARHSGSIVARGGVTQTPADGTAPVPEIYWDQRIRTGWPPDGWGLPRVVVTSWSAGP